MLKLYGKRCSLAKKDNLCANIINSKNSLIYNNYKKLHDNSL